MLLIFIDGLGLGANDAERNPLVAAATPTWRRLLGGQPLTGEVEAFMGTEVSFVPTDATLGVPGLPQSATGQTTLLTGENAAQVLGRHHNAFPPQALRELIARASILKQVQDMGLQATFANMFRDEYFTLRAEGKKRNSVTTEATLAAGLNLRTKADLLAGQAVYQDITNASLREKGYKVPLFSPEEAGRILADISRNYNFTLFEYFRTDFVGHRQNWQQAVAVLELLDRFYGSVLTQVDLKQTLVVLASDHGNIEDLTVKGHTFNPVPTLLCGYGHGEVARQVRDLTDIAPAILSLY